MSRRTKPEEERRAEIIQATLQVVGVDGLENATVSKIASACGLSVGTIAFHFSSKKALLSETLDFIASEKKRVWAERLEKPSISASEVVLVSCEASFYFGENSMQFLSAWFAYDSDLEWRAKRREAEAPFEEQRLEVLIGSLGNMIGEMDQSALEARPLAIALLAMSNGLAFDGLLQHENRQEPSRASKSLLSVLRSMFPKKYDSFGAIH